MPLFKIVRGDRWHTAWLRPRRGPRGRTLDVRARRTSSRPSPATVPAPGPVGGWQDGTGLHSGAGHPERPDLYLI